jgi:acetyl-CoA carboxylase biotin carboxyl carrier protein
MSDDSPINPALVRELAAILNETDLFEVEVRHGDLKLRLSRGPRVVTSQASYAGPAAAASAAPSGAAPTAPQAPEAANANAIASPMVGTVYLRPNPEDPVFFAPGSQVKEGDTILLIEAMKTFNPITAPRAGTLGRVMVVDGQPVEFGTPLFTID